MADLHPVLINGNQPLGDELVKHELRTGVLEGQLRAVRSSAGVRDVIRDVHQPEEDLPSNIPLFAAQRPVRFLCGTGYRASDTSGFFVAGGRQPPPVAPLPRRQQSMRQQRKAAGVMRRFGSTIAGWRKVS